MHAAQAFAAVSATLDHPDEVADENVGERPLDSTGGGLEGQLGGVAVAVCGRVIWILSLVFESRL